MTAGRRLLAAVSIAGLVAAAGGPAAAQTPGPGASPPVSTIQIEGVISPVTLRLVELVLDRAQAERAQALVILLDTPGGLERSMRVIVQRLLNAPIPVIVYVAPTGARASTFPTTITSRQSPAPDRRATSSRGRS